MLKSQDVLILLKLLTQLSTRSQASLALSLGLSQAEISQSLKRSEQVGLIDAVSKNVNRVGFFELLAYGIRFIFPLKICKPNTRGIPTAWAADPLRNKILQNETPLVWPHPEGTSIGIGVQPLYHSAGSAALADPELYRYLALVDALRYGKTREKELAKHELAMAMLGKEYAARRME